MEKLQVTESGRSVSLSSDGTIVAIGAINSNSNTGNVRVYDAYSSSDTFMESIR